MLKKIIIIIFSIMLTGLITAGLASCDAVSQEETIFSEIETVEAVATTDISGIMPEPLENEVIAGDITWKVFNVNVLGPEIVGFDNFSYTAVRGKFVNIEFMVNNNSEEIRTLFDLNVIDNKGRVYTVCLPGYGLFAARERACTLVDISPGTEYTFEAPFDIAPDSEGLVLEVTDLKIPVENKTYIDLGY